MQSKMTEEIAAEAKEQLWLMPQIPWTARGKKLVSKYLLHRLTEPDDYISWPKGCLLSGMVQAGMYGEAAAYFDLWIKKGAKLYTVDDLLAGQALLKLTDALERKPCPGDAPYRLNKQGRYERRLHRMMGFLYAHARDGQGSLPYRPLHKTNHIYADSLGMVCPFAIGYGVKYQDREAVKLAMKQFRNFFDNGMDPETGLPYHAYRWRKNAGPELLGAVGWGRAAGWILYGLGQSLLFLEQKPSAFEKEREELLQMTETLSGTVMQYQNREGLFGSFLGEASSPADTSATAMILHGIRMLPGEKYSAAYGQALTALQKYCKDGRVLQAQSECISLSQYGSAYGSFPWSVGMVLSLLVLSGNYWYNLYVPEGDEKASGADE